MAHLPVGEVLAEECSALNRVLHRHPSRPLHRGPGCRRRRESRIAHHRIVPEAGDPRVDLAQAHAVALPPHPVDDESEAAPGVEPRVERAECGRLRWELEEAEGGGEEGAAAVGREGHDLLDDSLGAQ
jgi:hypothetical protein